jgi:undecaprenyl-diphosphatase
MKWKDFFKADASLSEKIRIRSSTGILHALAAFLAHSGDSWVWMVLLTLVWFFAPGDWPLTAAVFFGGIFLTAFPVMTLKFLLQRPRPQGEWGQIYRKTDPHSFPSGHAARAAMFAALAFLISHPWSGAALSVWAVLVMISRVALGLHYFLDILVGLFLGVLMAVILYGLPILLPVAALITHLP